MKRNIILLFAVLLGLSWYSAISEVVNNPKKVKEHLKKAAELEEKEIYVDAIEEYEQALEYVPEDAAIQLRMAKAYLNSGNTKKFTLICEDTAETYQEQTEAMDLLMEYYVENDSESRAVKYLESFTEDYPDNENAAKWFSKLKGTYTELYCRYDEMSGIVNDSMVVLEDELYGIADASGQEMIASEYQELHPFSEDGFALAQKPDGAYIYIDKDGQTRKAPDAGYKNLGMLGSKSTVACKDGKYGYLDEDMEPAGKFNWDELTGFQDNAGAGKRDGKWVLVNRKGEAKEKKEAKKYDDVVTNENGFCCAQKRIFVKEGGSYYLINGKGKQIGELTFDDAKAFTGNGYAAVCKDGKWGYVDADGELVIDYTYEDAQSFQNGYAAVCIGGLWGYIDEEGELVIDAQFVTATKFSSSGTAAVKAEVSGEEAWKLIQLNIFS